MNNRHFILTRRRLLQLTGSTLAGSVLFGCQDKPSGQSSQPRKNISVFYNGVVLPVDEQFSEQQAFAVQDNKILAVGGNEAVLALAGTDSNIVNLNGQTVLPGFIEPHIHFAMMAFTGSWLDIGPLKYTTTEQALAALRKEINNIPEGEWIVARQFDPSLQAGPAALTTVELDGVSTTRPIFVLNASGHLAYVNSKFLQLADINKDTPNPPGGEYFRNEDGRPNGAMTVNAYLPILMRNPGLRQSFEAGAIEAGIGVGDEAATKGITTLCDMAAGAVSGYREIENFHSMFATGRMKSRIRAYLFSGAEKAWDESGVKFGEGNSNVQVSGWKIVSDGSNQGRTGRQREPYLNTDDHGLYYVPPEDLKKMAAHRGQQGWPLAIHGNGDAAIDSILDALEEAEKNGVDIVGLRCRVEHASILHDDQIKRMAKLGVTPSFLINHVHYWGQTMRDNIFGQDKVQLLDRCASVEKAGLKWTMHTDAPVSALGTLHKIRVAVARDLWSEPGKTLAPQEKVSVEAAIRAVTINAAWQCHSENEIGSLEVGKLADFIILDEDPRKVTPTAISDIKINQTWMGGNRVFRG